MTSHLANFKIRQTYKFEQIGNNSEHPACCCWRAVYGLSQRIGMSLLVLVYTVATYNLYTPHTGSASSENRKQFTCTLGRVT